MTTTGAGLKQLHELLLQLREIRTELESGPKQIAARRQFHEKKQADLDARRQKLKQLKVAADQKNLQLKANETKIAELQAKQNSVTSNRDYDILRGQIEADQMAKSVLEDEILEALETVDRAQGELKQYEQEVAAADGELQKFIQGIEQRSPGLKQQAESLQVQVLDAEKFLSGDVAAKYRRLVQVHGADALAAVENKSCSNCYLSLTTQMIVELNGGKLLFCNSCQRLLYLPGKA